MLWDNQHKIHIVRKKKEHFELYKIPKFGVNRANIVEDTATQKSENLRRSV